MAKTKWNLYVEEFLRQLHSNGILFISGGLQRALTSGKDFGFVFKLALVDDYTFGSPYRQEYTAEVEQIKWSSSSFEPQSCLVKRKLFDAASFSDSARRRPTRSDQEEK
ncbi:hypothetical protein CCR75_004424 [Bremia lactucae]|uniref:Uncharacterized protein n=1 Tax=Bremia lactucae TaxID=4779 RepID=A0A976FRE6_BRELC|nr:hypothetical protein CCR75_004424 [Bremia lactucae]